MTPQERQLVDDLFSRLASLESAPRDAAAVDAINAGLSRAPNALYALVQTVLLQDEALKRANDRIEALQRGSSASPPPTGGFLDSMRQMLGQSGPARTDVTASAGPWSRPGPRAGQWGDNAAPTNPGRGGSFLGTAAAAAAGVIGGSMLLSGIRSMMGTDTAHAFAPGSDGATSANDMARDAGIDDVARADNADASSNSFMDDSDFGGGDFGGGDSFDV